MPYTSIAASGLLRVLEHRETANLFGQVIPIPINPLRIKSPSVKAEVSYADLIGTHRAFLAFYGLPLTLVAEPCAPPPW